MATSTMRPLSQKLFLDEVSSLRSLRANALNSSSPSPETSSLKSGRFMFAKFLGSNRTSTDIAVVTENVTTPSPLKRSPLANDAMPTKTGIDDNQAATRPRSKSRTILRIIATKFTSRVTPAAQQPVLPRIPVVNSAVVSKENRHAALRERGLLPPLSRSKDLSLQELEQDLHLPIIEPTQVSDPSDSAKISAANRIKKEWEAKNQPQQTEERERMESFRLGGTNATPTEPESENLVAVKNNMPSPAASLFEKRSETSHTPRIDESRPQSQPLGQQSDPAGAKSTSSRNAPSSEGHSSLFPTEEELEAHFRALDSTPSQATPQTGISPPSVRSTNSQGTPLKATKPPNHLKLDLQDKQLPSTPSISLTPTTPPAACSGSPPGGSLESNRNRSDSVPTQISIAESTSSIATPSLDGSSQTMTISTLSTSESLLSPSRGKFGGLSLKTYEGQHISMIVESPTEDCQLSAEPKEDVLGVIAEEETYTSRPVRARRQITDPSALRKSEARKSFNPFKRGQTEDNTPSDQPPRRLAVSASLSNMRRSVVSSLSKPKSTLDFSGQLSPKSFDTSHSPPSPTPSAHGEAGRPGEMTSVGPRPRRAVDPVLHSRGSIILQTNSIEDDESRRMTEMAFSG